LPSPRYLTIKLLKMGLRPGLDGKIWV